MKSKERKILAHEIEKEFLWADGIIDALFNEYADVEYNSADSVLDMEIKGLLRRLNAIINEIMKGNYIL